MIPSIFIFLLFFFNQHGFLRGRSVQTNLIKILKNTFEALEKDLNDSVVALYTGFAKTFDRVPPYGLQKM